MVTHLWSTLRALNGRFSQRFTNPWDDAATVANRAIKRRLRAVEYALDALEREAEGRDLAPFKNETTRLVDRTKTIAREAYFQAARDASHPVTNGRGPHVPGA